MTDRLAEIKKHVDGGDGLSLTREEIDWLIAEVERLREIEVIYLGIVKAVETKIFGEIND
jgi:L-lysine 2,3-aminomutase